MTFPLPSGGIPSGRDEKGACEAVTSRDYPTHQLCPHSQSDSTQHEDSAHSPGTPFRGKLDELERDRGE